ncbi:MAG TPA: tripartite tricarboxylate transporter substrate binding protein, partial [Burkholderiales bacterium]|nr:tripartite tricarboxylate transporter substrate binding protein [Burkholderiales bacterium]
MSKRTAVALLAFAGASLTLPALAQMEKPRGFPERPLTIVVPYGPGGGSDRVSRALAPAMQQ